MQTRLRALKELFFPVDETANKVPLLTRLEGVMAGGLGSTLSDAAETAPKANAEYQALRKQAGLNPGKLYIVEGHADINAYTGLLSGDVYVDRSRVNQPNHPIKAGLAHELGHVQQRRWELLAYLGGSLGAFSLFLPATRAVNHHMRVTLEKVVPEKTARVAANTLAAPLYAGAGVLSVKAAKKLITPHFEYAADTKGIALTQDPQAAAASLREGEIAAQELAEFDRKARQSEDKSSTVTTHMKERANDAWNWLNTVHPKTEDRIRLIYEEHARRQPGYKQGSQER